jgi:hypothetical protein
LDEKKKSKYYKYKNVIGLAAEPNPIFIGLVTEPDPMLLDPARQLDSRLLVVGPNSIELAAKSDPTTFFN